MAMQPQLMVERVSHAMVQAAAMAPERREFYTTSDDRFIKAWNLDTGQLLRSFDAHRGKVTALVWVGSLRFVASTSLDHSLAVWNIKGECVARAKFPCAIHSAGYSTKYNAFIVGGVKKMFILKLVQNRDDWDFLVDKEFCEHTDFISQIICTPVGRIFSCGYDGIICAFEENVSEQIVVMTVGHGEHEVRARDKCHKGAITCATFNSESGTLITGGYDMMVKIWNYDSLTAHAQYIALSTLDLNRTILSLAYVKATRMVWVSTAGSHRPYLMDPRTGTNLTDFQPHVDFKEPLPGEHPTCLVATAGNEAVSVSDQKRLTIWRYNPLACVASVRAHTDWVEFLLPHPSSDHWGFVSGGADSAVRCWHSPSALYPELYSLRDHLEGHEGSVVAGVITADGSVLFTGGDDMIIRGWALEDSGPGAHAAPRSEAAATRATAEPASAPERKDAVGVERGASAHSTRDGGNADGAGSTFLTEGKAVGEAQADAAEGAAEDREAAVAAGAEAAAGGDEAAVRKRNIGVGKEAMYVRQGVPPEKALGKRAADIARAPSQAASTAPAAGGIGAAALGATQRPGAGNGAPDLGEQCVMMLVGHEARITALCLLDHYLVSVSADHSVRVWDSNTGTLWKTIEDAHDSEILDVAACPAHDTFCTVSADGLGYVWELETAELCGVCRGHSAGVSQVVWVERHAAWVTACDDSTLRMWEPDGQARIKVAEDKVGHDADLVGTLLEKSTGSDADGDGDGDGDGTGRDYPVMMKVDTEGFSALAVQARDGHVLVGLSDCSIAIIDLTREVTLHVYRGHEDLVRGAVCLMDKGLLITAGWDHSVRVWLLQGTSCGRTARKITHKASSGYPAEQSAVEAESRPYAERFPPYEPVSLKNDKGLGKLKKKSDQDREPHRESVCVRTRGGTEKFRIRVSGRVEV